MTSGWLRGAVAPRLWPQRSVGTTCRAPRGALYVPGTPVGKFRASNDLLTDRGPTRGTGTTFLCMPLSKPLPDVQPFEIRRSNIQGRGAFASRRIPKGMRIAEYTGERISPSEGDRRYDDEAMRRHHTFLFSISTRTMIDGAVGGNDARFINHSCEPNCDAVIEAGRIFIEAIANIPRGAELFYDYQYEPERDFTVDDLALYPCYCGTPSCRGTILTSPKARRKKRRKTASKHQRKHGRRA
jgi:uncharacterized protein